MTLQAVKEDIFFAERNFDDWVNDDRASRYVTSISYCFVDFEKFELLQNIFVAYGKLLPAVGKGTVEIMIIVNGKNEIKFLENSWFFINQ